MKGEGYAAMLKDFKELLVWQKSFNVCKLIFEFTSGFPNQEKYGLALQMRKAAVSIPSNIAEGYGRGSRKDYVRFLWIARGSACELETQLLLARDTGLGNNELLAKATELLNEVNKMLPALIKSLRGCE